MTVAQRTLQVTVQTPKAAGPPAPDPSPSNPQLTPVDLGDVILQSVTIVIPNGHAALTGIAIWQCGTLLVPFQTAQPWLIGNDSTEDYAVNAEVDTGLVIATYNLDVIFAHQHLVTFTYEPVSLSFGPSLTAELVPIT
jgi:hypothetical protein